MTPFIFTKFNSELFEFNKMLAVYFLTAIVTGIWILKMVSAKELIFKRTPLDYPLGLFLLSQILSTIFSIDPHTSIWGYYSRLNGGLLSVISYLLLYYVFVSNFEKEDVLKFLKGAVFSGALVAIYAIPEHFGLSPSCVILTGEFNATCWIQDVQARVFGTLGQPNWLAAYLSMLIFPASFFFLTAKNIQGRFAYFISLFVMYLAFTFTYSRGATLGLIAGFGVLIISQFLAFQPRVGKLNLNRLKPLGIIIASFVLVNLFFGSALTDFRILKSPAVPLRPAIAQTSGTQLENGGTESGQIRLIVWRGALEIFKAYPIFGSGVETFAYSYYQFRPVDHNLVSEWDFLYNKAHNEYLNYLATTGIFGFLTYTAIFLTFIGFCIKYHVSSIAQKNHDSSSLILTTTLLAGYTGYLIQNFFLFSVVSIALLFYLFPALVFTYLNSSQNLSSKNFLKISLNNFLHLITRKNLSKKLVQLLIILTVIFFLNSIVSIWRADKNYKEGTDYNDAGNPGGAYNFLIDAVRLNPGEPLYLSELGNAAASSSLAILEEDATVSGELKEDAEFFTDLSLKISPSNTSVLRTAIRTYFQLSLLDPDYESKTLEVVDKSIALAPTDPKLLLNKAVILTQFNKKLEAIDVLKKAIQLKPSYKDARLQLTQLYLDSKQKESAQEQIESILKLIPGDPDALKLEEQL